MHRQLSPGILLVVLAAGVLHAVWNALTKSVDDRLVVFGWIGAVSVVAGGMTLVVTGLPVAGAMWFALCSMAVHIVYQLGLIRSYRLGSFNQMYPLARGTSPLLVALGAFIVADERPGPVALAGILVLAGALIGLALSSGRLSHDDLPAVLAAFATGVSIAGYTLVDGLGARDAHDALAYAGFLFLLNGPPFILATAVIRRRSESTNRPVVLRGLAAGALSCLAYAAVIWAQVRAPLADVSALRETGVISAALIGTVFLHESFGRRRVAAAVFVAFGIVLIAL